MSEDHTQASAQAATEWAEHGAKKRAARSIKRRKQLLSTFAGEWEFHAYKRDGKTLVYLDTHYDRLPPDFHEKCQEVFGEHAGSVEIQTRQFDIERTGICIDGPQAIAHFLEQFAFADAPDLRIALHIGTGEKSSFYESATGDLFAPQVPTDELKDILRSSGLNKKTARWIIPNCEEERFVTSDTYAKMDEEYRQSQREHIASTSMSQPFLDATLSAIKKIKPVERTSARA